MNIRQIPHGAQRLTLAAVIGAAVVGSFALAPTATAQGQEPQQQGSSDGARMDPRQMIDQKMAKLTETLKLDSAQQDKVRSILADQTMEMEDLRKNSGGQRAGGGGGGGGGGRGRGGGGGMRGGGGGGRRGGAPPDSTSGAEGRGGSGGPPEEVRAIRDRANKRIEAVLKPEQLTTFRQLFEQPQQQRQTQG
jgi:hypothetical protein